MVLTDLRKAYVTVLKDEFQRSINASAKACREIAQLLMLKQQEKHTIVV